jgi:hypothetical protein
MAPGATALFLISTLAWGYIWFPAELAVALLVFDVYWLWKSWTIAYHVVKGVRLMRRFQATNWRQQYEATVAKALPDVDVIAWEDVRHVVIIPNYSESLSKLRQTLSTMAAADGARESVIPVLAMEAAEEGCELKARELFEEFGGAFNDLLVTYHPKGIIGEVRGKSSNESWAARHAVAELVERRGMDVGHLTVTSCDADTQFPNQYFDCLTYHFATDELRYRRFWQAPIFFYNNIWQVPAPLRVPNAIAGLVHLSRLTRKRKVLFSQSTYSLSMKMAHEVGYWDTDVIPEDWHMFLKCFYTLGGTVEVQPIHLPIGNDGALSHGVKATFANHYLQVRRWAWGAVDIPYALHEAVHHSEISWSKRLLRFWYLVENHIMWSTQWFFITLGGLIPKLMHMAGGDDDLTPKWFYLNEHAHFSWMPDLVTIPSLFLTPCLVLYIGIIVLDSKLRPPAPVTHSKVGRVAAYLCWIAVAPITFFCSALPALDSQVRLMLGRRMEYRVTEKV